MNPKTNRLLAVPALVDKTGFDYRFEVAYEVMGAGTQDSHVQAIVPVSGPGGGQAGGGVGRRVG